MIGEKNILDIVNGRLRKIEKIINNETPVKTSSPYTVGIDLGTSDIVLMVIDEEGNPVAAFMEWADVVRDGIVFDFWKAVQIVKTLINKAEKKLSIKIKSVATSYPPGTDSYISINVINSAGLEVDGVVDEPSSFAGLLKLTDGAVVDIGGGTTGISIVKDGSIIYTADEPTGGHHVSLTIAGNQKISLEDAELIKRSEQAVDLKAIVFPVFDKMTDIVKSHILKHEVSKIYLTGGTCCFPGIESIFKNNFPNKEIVLPYNPLYSTPLSIASNKTNLNSGI